MGVEVSYLESFTDVTETRLLFFGEHKEDLQEAAARCRHIQRI
jgi:hypothetical protein